MYEDVLGHMQYTILNTRVSQYPFPHVFVRNVFPQTFYDQIRAALPDLSKYGDLEGAKYGSRVFNDASDPVFDLFKSANWTNLACKVFKRQIIENLGSEFPASTDLRLVSDAENYKIGPHTDAKHKVLSFLFYLPPDESLAPYGTSIFLPNDPEFRCPGGPHHKFDQFTKIATMPFIPNSLFAFFKTDNSFHGVEPITIPCRRDVLLWNLYTSRGK